MVDDSIPSSIPSIPTPPYLHHLILRGIETAQLLPIASARFQQVHMGEERRAGHRVEHVGEGGVLRRVSHRDVVGFTLLQIRSYWSLMGI